MKPHGWPPMGLMRLCDGCCLESALHSESCRMDANLCCIHTWERPIPGTRRRVFLWRGYRYGNLGDMALLGYRSSIRIKTDDRGDCQYCMVDLENAS